MKTAVGDNTRMAAPVTDITKVAAIVGDIIRMAATGTVTSTVAGIKEMVDAVDEVSKSIHLS